MASRSNIEGARIAYSILAEKNRFLQITQTLGATFTIDDDMPALLFLDPDGAGRTVLLPPEAKGLWFLVINTSSGDYNLTVKEDANTTTIGVVGQGEIGKFYCDGTTWWGDTARDSQNLALGGTLTVTGATTLNGNVLIGDAAADTIGFYGATKIAQPSSAQENAITDNSGGTVSDTIAATAAYQLFGVRLTAASLANSQEYQFDPGFAGSLMAINARTVEAVTTSAKAATVTGRVNAGALGGGGVVSLAGVSAIGVQTAGTAITGAKAFTAAQTVGFTVGSVTTFVEGAFVIELQLRNDDLNTAIAKSAQLVNRIRTDLVNLGLIKGSV